MTKRYLKIASLLSIIALCVANLIARDTPPANAGTTSAATTTADVENNPDLEKSAVPQGGHPTQGGDQSHRHHDKGDHHPSSSSTSWNPATSTPTTSN